MNVLYGKRFLFSVMLFIAVPFVNLSIRGALTQASPLAIEVSSDSRITFSGDIVTITVRVMNGTDPVYNATVDFVSNLGGNFTPLQGFTNLTGFLVTRFRVPLTLEPVNATISIKASKIDFTDSQSNVSIFVLPPMVIGSLRLVVMSSTLTINSGNNATISVKVTDGTIPISNASIFLYCENGSFLPGGGTTNSSGDAVFTYVSPQTRESKTVTIYAFASKAGYIASSDFVKITVNPPVLMYHAQIADVTFPSYSLLGQKMRLDAKIKNPSTFDIDVRISVMGENVSVFPSIYQNKTVSPSGTSTTKPTLQSFQFDVTASSVGEHSLEIQAWQNEKLVDSYLLTFTTFEPMNPSLRAFWVFTMVSGFSLILYSFAVIALLNPEATWPKKIQSGTKTYNIGKHLILAIVTIMFGLVAYWLAVDIPLYYNMLPYFVPLVGKIEPVVGIGVFLSAFAWVFQMRKKYLVSSLFGDVLFLLVVFSLVWNSLLIPIYPLTLSESILVQVLITFLLKSVFMLLEWGWQKRRKQIETINLANEH